MIKVTPFLWFENQALEAAKFYVSIFKNSKIINESPMMVIFELEGQKVMALNGGPHFKLSEAFSFFVSCQTQVQVDEYWEKLSEGGEESRCGWLKDKFGLSWQIIPDALGKYLSDPDPAKSQNVMNAMLKMSKISISELEQAYNQR
jgi:predicted 3-demethylubiquinone-9 3-methyltransferase (glyoxalase superfamily)